MSCPACALHRGGFKSEAEFIAFRSAIAEAVVRGDLIGGELQPGGEFFVQTYACRRCDAQWRLSHPDLAYRGDWAELPIAGA